MAGIELQLSVPIAGRIRVARHPQRLRRSAPPDAMVGALNKELD